MTCNVDRRGKMDGTGATRGPQRGRLEQSSISSLPSFSFDSLGHPPLSTPIPIPPPSRYSTKTVRAPGTTSSFTFSQTHTRSDSPSYRVILSTDFLHCHAPFSISRMPETDILNTTYLRANSHWRSDDPSPSTTHIWTTHTSNFP